MSAIDGLDKLLASTRTVLAGADAWLVGGALRDRLMDRVTGDLDLIVAGEAEPAARAVARATNAFAFELSDTHGAWRVVDREGAWQVDLTGLRGGALEADLRLRDFTVNAMAEPLAGGEIIDPTGGLADLSSGCLRMVAPDAFERDPLRSLRLARLACELDLEVEPDTARAARLAAPGLTDVAAERVFGELRRIISCGDAARGLDLMDELESTGVVLPELAALRGVQQNRFHHLDVHDHTRAVLDEVMAIERKPAAIVGEEHAAAVADLLAEPLADGVTRGTALRLGALLHDAAKPATRATTADGRVTFIGHDAVGAELATAVLSRLRTSERLRAHVAGLTRHHLRLGFLVHRRPLGRREVYRYLRDTEPVAADVTLLSIADRLATQGDNAREAIAAHLQLARQTLGEALLWRAHGRPGALIRGDELAAVLEIAPGPQLGGLLDELAEARFAGDVADRDQAIAYARRSLGLDQ